MNRILDNSARTVTAARLQTRMVDLVVLVVGIIFTFLGVWGLVRYEDALLVALFGLLGAVFVVFGLRGLSRKAQYPRIESPATTAEHSDVVVR
jgi:multisubunit Na+/H+ antiporter MnhG subunit